MSETIPAPSFYGSEVRPGAGEGMVFFGALAVSAADAASFVMMYRTQVMKEVGAQRTELAQQQLERIRMARQYLIDLRSLQRFLDADDSFRGRAPVTPAMVEWLKQEVGASPGEGHNRVLFYGSAVPKLPQSVREHYGLYVNPDGEYVPWSPKAGHYNYDIYTASGNNQYELKGATVINKDEFDTLKEQVNNYIDQLNDTNNLFMTKFKSVVNNMNTALEGANSLTDKIHDTLKNLFSRW